MRHSPIHTRRCRPGDMTTGLRDRMKPQLRQATRGPALRDRASHNRGPTTTYRGPRGPLMAPYAPPKPAGRNPAVHNEAQGLFCLLRIKRNAHVALLPQLALHPHVHQRDPKNASHHHPQTVNLGTAHQPGSRCLACVYWGRDEDASTHVEACSLTNHP